MSDSPLGLPPLRFYRFKCPAKSYWRQEKMLEEAGWNVVDKGHDEKGHYLVACTSDPELIRLADERLARKKK